MLGTGYTCMVPRPQSVAGDVECSAERCPAPVDRYRGVEGAYVGFLF
jgi:hypothetical protein